jgi:D-alanine-D-alanine ligase
VQIVGDAKGSMTNLQTESGRAHGGTGSERKVSLASGAGIANALRSLGATVVEVDVQGPDFDLPEGVSIAFNAIHGTFGEDGQIQRIMESRGIPYTGEGVAGKRAGNRQDCGEGAIRGAAHPDAAFGDLLDGAEPTLRPPFVVKAPREGSSVGVYIVREAAELEAALRSRERSANGCWWRLSSLAVS